MSLALALFASCAFLKTNTFSKKNVEEIHKVTTLPATDIEEKVLVDALHILETISNNTIYLNYGDDCLYGVSYILRPVSNGQILERQISIDLNNMSIFDAFQSLADKCNLVLDYKDGRFVFSDPNWVPVSVPDNPVGSKSHP